MNKTEAEELLSDLEGNEHAWIDFKEDYYIGGIAKKKAEFIRDIASLANTRTSQEEHFLFIGVNDQGVKVGVSTNSETYDGAGPRHIFSYDGSDIQEIIDSNLNPAPTISWHTYDNDGDPFGILVVTPLNAPPAITNQDIYDNSGNRLLHEGLIFVRKSSGKMIAGREEVESLIEFRIRQQREEILDGINKAIQLGPEWIERLEGTFEEGAEVPLTTAESSDEADMAVAQRITREPASTLDEQLNEDISRWKGRGDDFIDAGALWEYYASYEELRLDDVALRFLTQSAISNSQLGVFWLEKTDEDIRKEILLETPNKHHRIVRAGKALLLMDDTPTFDHLIDQSSANTSRADLQTCKQKLGNTVADRVNYLLKSGDGYSLKHNDWEAEFRPQDLGEEEIRDLIPPVSKQLCELQELYEQQMAWDNRQKFFNALWDLEVVLGREVFN
jgi:hypothetical protein